jgi:hypothetical protein
MEIEIKNTFEEKQYLVQNKVGLFATIIANAALIWSEYVMIDAFIKDGISTSFVILYSILTIYFVIFFPTIKLVTTINQDGIFVKYHFFPFKLKRKFLWSEIKSCGSRKYKPILEYGGWGIKFGFGSGTAYSMSGNIGLQLRLMNKKFVLIGTQKSEKINAIFLLYY